MNTTPSAATPPREGESTNADEPGQSPTGDPAPDPEPHAGEPAHTPPERQALRLFLVDVQFDGVVLPGSVVEWLIEKLEELARPAGVTKGELRVTFVDDSRMTREHKRLMLVDSTTDVMCIDFGDGGFDQIRGVDADLLVCVDEARRQAEARKIPLEHELLLYCLHGLLHCLDYDDTTDAGYQRMHAREDELLRAVGLPAMFRGES
jgi:probable rRNA maturation factor